MPSKTLKLNDAILDIDEGMDRYNNLPDETIEYIAELGIKLPRQPIVDGEPFVPEIPTGPDGTPSLSHLSNRELSDLNTQFLTYKDYVIAQSKIHKIAHITLEKSFAHVKAKVRALHSGSPADKSDKTIVDRRVQDADFLMTEAWCRVEIINGIIEALDKDLAVISREVAIRDQDLGFHGRDSRIKSRKKKDYDAGMFGIDEEDIAKSKAYLNGKKKKPRKDPR